MGFAWFQLRDAQVTEDEVAIQILATDQDPGQVEEIVPGDSARGAGRARGRRDVAEEPGPGGPLAEATRLHI